MIRCAKLVELYRARALFFSPTIRAQQRGWSSTINININLLIVLVDFAHRAKVSKLHKKGTREQNNIFIEIYVLSQHMCQLACKKRDFCVVLDALRPALQNKHIKHNLNQHGLARSRRSA